MKCPHCQTAFNVSWQHWTLAQEQPKGGAAGEVGDVWSATAAVCPECGRLILRLLRAHPTTQFEPNLVVTAWPQNAVRPLPPEVEDPYARDFQEAAATLSVSAKASAALSRRCLQAIIHDKAGIKKRNLDQEIDALIASSGFPSFLADNVDAVRVMGNFAAHPIKSTNSGEIVDVEPGEAEFLLDVLEGLFDFYFVLPKRQHQKRAAIDAKLKDASKPPLKRSPKGGTS